MSSRLPLTELQTQTSSKHVLRYLDFEGTRATLREHLCGKSDLPIAKSASVILYTLKKEDRLYCVEDTTFTPEKYERDIELIDTASYYGLPPLESGGSYFSIKEPFDPVFPPVFEILDGVMVLTAGLSALFKMMTRMDGRYVGVNVILIRHVLFRPVVDATVPQPCPITAHEYREINWTRSERGERRRIIFV